jgi:hypothetical protein
MYMLLVFVLLTALLGFASHRGWSVDSRDGADWRPTRNGVRAASLRL